MATVRPYPAHYGATDANAMFENDVVPGTRGNVFPAAQYTDGQYHLAWPGLIAQPLEGFNAMWERGDDANITNPEALDQSSRESFDAAGLAATGGLAAGMAGAVPEGAVAANGIGARIKGLFGGKPPEGEKPFQLPPNYPGQMRAENGNLRAWHVSPSKFDKFDPEKSGTFWAPNDYPGSFFFAGEHIAGPEGGLTKAKGGFESLNGPVDDWKPYSYEVEISDNGIPVLDLNKPFSHQTPEAQALLDAHKNSTIKQHWPLRSTEMPTGKPETGKDFDWQPNVPIVQQFDFGPYLAMPKGLDDMGFGLVHNLDETMVRDANRIKIMKRNGEDLYSNSPTGASVPLAFNDYDEQQRNAMMRQY